MKKLGFAATFVMQLFCSQIVSTQDYQKIPDVFDTPENIYPFIKPSENLSYWKVFTNHSDPEKAVLYESQYPEPMTILEPIPEKGFFQKCLGENCFHYIIACKRDRPEYFTNEKDLRSFIGEVDNIGEAVLIANTFDFSIDITNPEGGSFKKDEQNFYLKTFRSKKCTEVRESFLLTIRRKNGAVRSQSKGIYTSKKNCE